MNIYFGKRKISVGVKKVSEFGKFMGLMFKSSKTDNLLFDFAYSSRWAIHSYFVFFDFYAVFLDENDKIMEVRKVRPFTFIVKPREVYKKLVEIPCNSRNMKIIDFLVGKRKI